jgi:Holliday junction DNA helicase RuvB
MTTPMLADSQYPHRWNEYIGQKRAKDSLRIAAKSARMRRKALDHVLIAHPEPGIGKTALAVLTASEINRPARVVSGPMTSDQARWVFSEMQDQQLLIYDEFHRLFEGGKKSWAWCLNYMQDGLITGPLGSESMPRVTIIATTTEGGILPRAVVTRFLVRPKLVPYTHAEGARIAQRMGRDVLDGLPDLQRSEAMALARGAASNPRAIRQLLTVLRDLTVTGTLPHNGRYDIKGLLRWEGITDDGLDPVAQQYLVALATELGGVAGERTMVDRLQQPGGISTVERLLMDRGLVAKTRTGRALTRAGMIRARQLMKEAA